MNDALRQKLAQLSPEQRTRLLADLAARKQAAEAAPPRVDRGGDLLPTRAQESLWVLSRIECGTPFTVTAAYDLRGPLDPSALEQALCRVVEASDWLHLYMHEAAGEPRLRYAASVTLNLTVVQPAAADASAIWARMRDAVGRTPFSARTAPAARLLLVRLGANHHKLVVGLHRVVADADTLTRFVSAWGAAYRGVLAGRSAAPSPAYGLADFAAWTRGVAREAVLRDRTAALKDAPAQLDLPTDAPRPLLQGHVGERLCVDVDPERLARIDAFCALAGTTRADWLAACFALVLGRLAGRTELVMGVAMKPRGPVWHAVDGATENPVPVRLRLAGLQNAAALAQEAARALTEAEAARDLPFEDLAAALHPAPRLDACRVFQVLFRRLQDPTLDVFAGVETTVEDTDAATLLVDVELAVVEGPRGMRGVLTYDAHLFQAQTMRRLAERLVHVAAHLPSLPAGVPPAYHALLHPDEQAELLYGWNQSGPAQTGCEAASLFEQQVARTPEAPALTYLEESYTYAALNAAADRLAARFADGGVGDGGQVAVLCARTPLFAAAALAAFKRGAAYIPLDPHHPDARLAAVMASARPALLVASDDLTARAATLAGGVPVAAAGDPFSGPPAVAMPARRLPQAPAYVMFTSGSTGKPKGVVISQEAMCHHILGKIDEIALTAGDVVAQTASQAFDISVWQLFAALLVGGRVVMVEDAALHAPEQLCRRLTHATVAELVPSFLLVLLDTLETLPEAERLPRLRLMNLAGEASPFHLAARWFAALPRAALLNVYAPTECADGVATCAYTAPPTRREAYLPIGRAIAGMQVYVLDAHLNPVPRGANGMLYAAGAGLATAYAGAPALTAAAFLPDPFGKAAGGRLYRTGDLVRLDADASLVFLGRADHQEKVRGHRLELGDIEAVLLRRADIDLCAVVVQRFDGDDDKRLVAYYQGAGPVDDAVLHAHVADALPDYMVPAFFHYMDALPRNANQKIDRGALPAVREQARTTAAGDLPRSAEQELLVGVWAEVLNRASVGIHDNFFQMGGDSLLALRMAGRLVARGYQLDMTRFLQHPTIAESRLSPLHTDAGQLGREERFDFLIPSQRWYLSHYDPENHLWGAGILMDLPETYTQEIVRQALEALHLQHDFLRYRLVRHDDGTWACRIASLAETGVSYYYFDLSDLPDDAARHAEIVRLNDTYLRRINGVRGPMYTTLQVRMDAHRTKLLALGKDDQFLTNILAEDFRTLCDALVRGETPPLPHVTAYYGDYIRAMERRCAGAELVAEVPYWLAPERLQAYPVAKDHAVDVFYVKYYAEVIVGYDEAFTRRLLELAAGRKDLGINHLLMYAFARAFCEFFQTPYMRMDVEANGRVVPLPGVDLSRVIGSIHVKYPLLLHLPGGEGEAAALQRVVDTVDAVPHQGLGYGLLRYCHADASVRDRLAAVPAPKVFFNNHGMEFNESAPPFSGVERLEVEAEDNPDAEISYDLMLNSYVTDFKLEQKLIYSSAMYRSETIERLLARVQEILLGVPDLL